MCNRSGTSLDYGTFDYTERERKMIRDCLRYARDPSGLPGHNLMVLVAKLHADLLALAGIAPVPAPNLAGSEDGKETTQV